MNFTFRIYNEKDNRCAQECVKKTVHHRAVTEKKNEKPEYSTTVVFSTNLACLCSESHPVVSDCLQPHGLSGSSVHGILQARILE